jgi:hypothetical protein
MAEKKFVSKIIFDIIGAINPLKRLERQTKKSTKNVNRDFKSFSKVTDGVVDAIGKINPAAGRAAQSMVKLGAKAGPAGLAIAAVGTAAVVTAANVFKLADSMRDYDAIIGKFLTNAKKAQSFADSASAGIDAGLDFEFSEAKRFAAIRRGQLTENQIASENAISRAQEAISVEKSKLRQIESLQAAARRKRLSAEERLKEKLNEGVVAGSEFANRPKGRQVGDLTAKAASEARKGNIDTAEALIERAKELSGELGNHVFFTKQIDQANNAVVRAMKKNVDSAKKNEKGLEGQANQLKKSIADSEARLKKERAVKRIFDEQLRTLSAQTAEISKQKRFESQRQAVDQGARDLGSATKALQKIFKEMANPGTLRRGAETLQAGFRGVTSPSTLGTVKGGAGALSALEQGISNALLKAFEGGTTRAKLTELAQFGDRASGVATDLQEDIDAGTLSPAIQDRLTRMITALDSIDAAVKANKNFGPLGLNENVRAGQQRVAEQADAAAAAVTNFNNNIQVQIKGGAIDGEVIKKLEPEIRRAARKAVSELKTD